MSECVIRNSGDTYSTVLRRAVTGVALAVQLSCLALCSQFAQAQQTNPNTHTNANKTATQALSGLIETYCDKCHNAEDWAGKLAFDVMDLTQLGADPKVWETTVNKLRGRLMPPAGAKQPTQADVDGTIKYLEASIDANNTRHHIGHVPIQRLNRTEFAESVKALIGVDIDPTQVLPTEIEVEGFNNIASALAISPAFMEQYLSVARRAARLAVGDPVPKMAKVFMPATPGQAAGYPLGTRGLSSRGGGMSFTYFFPADGEYRFNVPEEDFLDIGLYPRGAENPATLVVLVDGVEVARREIGGGEFLDIADRDGPAGKKVILSRVSSAAQITAGRHEVVLTYIERSRALSNDAAGGGRLTTLPIIQTGIEVEGPFSPKGLSMSESRAKIFVCQPKHEREMRPCAERIARHMASQAFRRPTTDDDIKILMKFYDMGRAEAGGFDAGITELLTAILSSPDFLYRAIPTPNKLADKLVSTPTGTPPGKQQEARLLTDLELASRLSFLMWNTGPDPELLDLASSKRLSNPAVIKSQVDRMLKDSRANTLVENFALAWLNLDELEKVDPVDRSFTTAMRTNFETEIRLFLASVLLENRSVVDLLNADWTFVNDSLARQYDIPNVHGAQFRRVKIANVNRLGLLGKGAVLMRTSYGDRTSPVLRGAWVLDRIMGTPPSPPPPNVNTDLAVKDGAKHTTVRARLEEHRTNPTCNACHGLIDPPGLALENFDVTGRWRDFDAAARAPIDARTEMSSGRVLNGPVELRDYLMSRPDQFPTTVTKRLMMYALNREVEYSDMPQVRQIVNNAAADNYRFADLINGIVNSDAFRRQGPEEHKKEEHQQTAANTATKPASDTTTRTQALQ